MPSSSDARDDMRTTLSPAADNSTRLNRGTAHAARHHRQMTRRWLERAVIVAAALASIATSPRRWRQYATSVPAISDAARTTRVVVHASFVPTVELVKGGARNEARYSALGHDDYEVLVPPGWSLGGVYVAERCKVQLLCGSDDCVPPPGTVVEVTSATPVATWHLEAATPPTVTELDPAMYMTTVILRLRVPAPRPVTIKVETAAGEPAPNAYASGSEATVLWDGVRTRTTVHWTARVSIDGPCPSAAPCEPPPGDFAITSIEKGADAPR
jgi:hypothetical protein